MRKLLLVAIAAVLMAALPASADTLDYTLSGAFGTLSWTMDIHPTPDIAVNGVGFELIGVSTNAGLDNITFFNAGNGGGLGDLLLGYNLFGPQVYIGPESSPTMLAGVFVYETGLGSPATLTATPEPASLLLLGTGLIGLGSQLRKRL